MMPTILCNIYQHLNLNNKVDLVAFFLMLQKSNLAPDSVRKFSSTKQLTSTWSSL